MAGILFPKGGQRSDLKAEGEDFADNESRTITSGGEEFSGDEDNPLSMANEELPCSVGISFLVPERAGFTVEVRAASYVAAKNDLGQSGYLRVPLQKESVSSALLKSEGSEEVLGGRARLILTERPSTYTAAGKIVTVSLLNIQEVKKNKKGLVATRSEPEKWLFQTGLSVKCEQGFAPYHTENAAFADPEDQILALQYSDSPVFAVGHGASVDWTVPDNASAPNVVNVAYLPAEFVHRPVFDRLLIDEHRSLELETLWDIKQLAFSDSTHKKIWFKEAREFLSFFQEWVGSQAALSAGEYKDAASSLHMKMTHAAARMAIGVDFLEKDEGCWDAFCLANRAMLFQMEQVIRLKKLRKDREQSGADWPIPFDEKVPSYNGEPELFPENFNPSWRPFQLAFFLLTVFGMEDIESDDHDVADLIWFSTGGGKTEAYLLLASYEMIRRRQRRPEDKEHPGTAVITRYTLRFLTADQLARTASLMCAMEKVRQFSDTDLGNKSFRVGLYIGIEKNSYKDLAQAESALQELWSDT
ncbi:hypothetical protein N9T52_00005, partial [bacterium]|nr:hypothetical protein [bacterium]